MDKAISFPSASRGQSIMAVTGARLRIIARRVPTVTPIINRRKPASGYPTWVGLSVNVCQNDRSLARLRTVVKAHQPRAAPEGLLDRCSRHLARLLAGVRR